MITGDDDDFDVEHDTFVESAVTISKDGLDDVDDEPSAATADVPVVDGEEGGAMHVMVEVIVVICWWFIFQSK